MSTEPNQESSLAEDPYLLGTTDREISRLAFQHRVWSEQAFALWDRAGFKRGQTILDAGSGPGFAAMDLARLIGPQGRVIAIDESPRFIDYLNRQPNDPERAALDGRVGDVQRLDLPAESIDGAFCRWVMCFVNDPGAVIAGIAKALKPGGVLAVQDYFAYQAISLAPHSPALARVAQAVMDTWQMHGGDINVTGRLPELMAKHGLEVKEIKPIVRVAKPGTPLWHWPQIFFEGFCPVLIECGALTSEEHEAFNREWAKHAKNPHAFFFTPPILDLIAVKKR